MDEIFFLSSEKIKRRWTVGSATVASQRRAGVLRQIVGRDWKRARGHRSVAATKLPISTDLYGNGDNTVLQTINKANNTNVGYHFVRHITLDRTITHLQLCTRRLNTKHNFAMAVFSTRSRSEIKTTNLHNNNKKNINTKNKGPYKFRIAYRMQSSCFTQTNRSN